MGTAFAITIVGKPSIVRYLRMVGTKDGAGTFTLAPTLYNQTESFNIVAPVDWVGGDLEWSDSPDNSGNSIPFDIPLDYAVNIKDKTTLPIVAPPPPTGFGSLKIAYSSTSIVTPAISYTITLGDLTGFVLFAGKGIESKIPIGTYTLSLTPSAVIKGYSLSSPKTVTIGINTTSVIDIAFIKDVAGVPVKINTIQSIASAAPLKNVTFEWTSKTDGLISYEFTEDQVLVKDHTSISFNFINSQHGIFGKTCWIAPSGNSLTAISGGNGKYNMMAGWKLTVPKNIKYVAHVTLTGVDSKTSVVGLGNFAINANPTGKKGIAKVTFDLVGADSSTITIGDQVLTNVINGSVETVDTSSTSTLYMTPEIKEGYLSVCVPEYISYGGSSSTQKVVVTYTQLMHHTSSKNSTLPGWPDHVAMGTMLNPDVHFSEYSKGGALDMLSVYASEGGPIATPGAEAYIYPTQCRALVDHCAALTTYQTVSVGCRPLPVIYTANLSGGNDVAAKEQVSVYEYDGVPSKTPFANARIAAANLASVATYFYTFQERIGKTAIYSKADVPSGAVCLNPDFLSWLAQHPPFFKSMINAKLSINYILGFLFNWLETNTIEGTYERNGVLTTLQGTPLTFIKQLGQCTDIGAPGATYADSFNTAWLAYTAKYTDITIGKPFPTSVTCTFEDTLYGYIEAVNYIGNRYAPEVAFGWDCGVYFTDTKNWVYEKAASSQAIVDTNVSDFYAKLPLVNSANYLKDSDFIYCDRASYSALHSEYEFDAGWLWNTPAYDNWFYYIDKLTTLYDRPAMLWQIPGGRLPNDNDAFTWAWGTGYFDSFSNYMFGVSNTPKNQYNPAPGLTQLPSGLGGLVLSSLYGVHVKGTLLPYLLETNDSAVAWQNDHLKTIADAGVFAIEQGGVNAPMSGLNQFAPYPNEGWLGQAVKTYRSVKNPYPFK